MSLPRKRTDVPLNCKKTNKSEIKSRKL